MAFCNYKSVVTILFYPFMADFSYIIIASNSISSHTAG